MKKPNRQKYNQPFVVIRVVRSLRNLKVYMFKKNNIRIAKEKKKLQSISDVQLIERFL